MRTWPLLLECADPDCARAQLIAVQRSGPVERATAIRSVGWTPDEDTYVHVWCPDHGETRRLPKGAS